MKARRADQHLRASVGAARGAADAEGDLLAAVAGSTVTEPLDLLQSGDAIVDGGNSSYRDLFAAKVQSAQRLEFGGHVERRQAS